MSSKEMVISSNRHETRVALLEDDQLVEVYFQRANEYSLAGSIHKGRVTRVLPGMQSAFVDLGLERDTFLYVSDFMEEHDDIDQITGDERPPRGDRGRDRRPVQQPQTVAAAPASEIRAAAASEAGSATEVVEAGVPLIPLRPSRILLRKPPRPPKRPKNRPKHPPVLSRQSSFPENRWPSIGLRPMSRRSPVRLRKPLRAASLK